MSELQFVDLNERAYKYIRQFTIKSAEDALIELITNCVDAYNTSGKLLKKIEIEYHEASGAIKVRDFAIGLTGTDMENSFLQVGEYTNSGNSRGFFSRGAKDISAIGDVLFETVKDNKYSRVYLNNDAYGKVEIIDQEIDQKTRDSIGISEPFNGLLVTLSLLDNFRNFDPSLLATSISKLGVLRDIMTDKNNEILFTHYDTKGIEVFTRRLTFDYAPGTLLLDLEYNVPGYDKKSARLVIYKADAPIQQPIKENEMEFGFLIRDSTTVYEISTIADKFRWNPYMPHIYGTLTCENIHELLKDFDSNGATTKNPVPIIDPSRLTGVNKQHPFIIALLSIPKVRIDQILRELNLSVSQQSITLTEVNDLFDELAKYGLDIVENEAIKVSFVPSYDAKLAKAIEDDRMNFVTQEKNYLLTANYNTNKTESDMWIEEEILKITPQEDETNYIYISDANGNLIPIPKPSQHQNKSTREFDLLNVIDDDQISNLQKRPYVYEINENGQLVKLYIFEKGRIEQITNPENEYVIVKDKKFEISFINDLNIKQRYIIEYNHGVHIKININATSVRKYLVSPEWEGVEGAQLSVENINSTKSLIFVKDLMTEVLADIILENDIINNKLILDSSNFNNTKKILRHRNELVAKIEEPLEDIFDKYINKNWTKKVGQLNEIMDQISTLVGNKINMDAEGGEITLLKAHLDNTLATILE